MKEFLSQNEVRFAYLGITDGMGNLKKFLKLRDHEPAFEEIKEAGRVGIPCVTVEDTETGELKIFFTQPDLAELK